MYEHLSSTAGTCFGDVPFLWRWGVFPWWHLLLLPVNLFWSPVKKRSIWPWSSWTASNNENYFYTDDGIFRIILCHANSHFKAAVDLKKLFSSNFNTDVIVRYWNIGQWNELEKCFKFFLKGWFEHWVSLAWLAQLKSLLLEEPVLLPVQKACLCTVWKDSVIVTPKKFVLPCG